MMAVCVGVDLIGWWEYVAVLRNDRMDYSMLDLAPCCLFTWPGANGQLGRRGQGRVVR